MEAKEICDLQNKEEKLREILSLKERINVDID
jgi:hypothetical protein